MADENIIHMASDLHVRRHRELAAKIVDLVEFRGFERIVLDFGRVEICFPDAVVPIVALARKYRQDGVRFDVRLPKIDKLSRLFINSNWAALISPEQHPASTYSGDLNLAATEYRDHDEQHAFVRETIDRILKVTRHLDRSHLRGLEWSLNEISDNVLVHAESATGGIGQLSIRPSSRELEFVVCDAGIGIAQSLRSAKMTRWNDLEALEQATLEGMTRGVGQGNGLFGSLQVATLSGGAFSINSGFAFLAGVRGGPRIGQLLELAFHGTSVVCAISYAKPFALEQALKFKGRTHTPVDFMEMDYEGFEANSTIVAIANETVSVGSRRSGFELRTKIENIARMVDSPRIVLDFGDLPVLASSFADEAVAKLIASYGIDTFLKRFRLIKVDSVNRQIIFRSVQQRLAVMEDRYFE